jgi:hypothetical protein
MAYCADRYRDVRMRSNMVGRTPTTATVPQPATEISQNNDDVRVTRHFLAKFKKDCDDMKARLVVAYIPGQAELGEDDFSVTEDVTAAEQIGYRKAFFNCTDSLDIETIDLLPYLLKAKNSEKLERITFKHDFHWNESGHAIAAQAICSFLK